MGKRVETRIDTVRAWIDPEHEEQIPDLDYRVIHPVSEYDAIHQTEDETSPTLTDDLNQIKSDIGGKQDKLVGGTAGDLMTWRSDGEIGSTPIATAINNDETAQSNQKVASERAVGQALKLKTDQSSFNAHIKDPNLHITEEERDKWNSMADGSALTEHVNNHDIHTSLEEKTKWDNKADAAALAQHVNNTANPHRVTANQVGTYSAGEIDKFFQSIREAFFNYKQIEYTSRTDTAVLVEHADDLIDPNYILQYGESLPTVTDTTLQYFAIRPVTDYSTNKSNEVIIYLKEPGLSWREVGLVEMSNGDMLMRSADDAMHVWTKGRFLIIQTGTPDEDQSTLMWRPVISPTGVLTFVRSSETTPPDPINIKGEAGYTPQKGVDYFDGMNGIGIPDGGNDGQFIVKASGYDYDTRWMTFAQFIDTYVSEEDLPLLLSDWNNIKNKPTLHQDFGSDTHGFISQSALTERFQKVDQSIDSLEKAIGQGVQEELNSHKANYNNPHRVTASQVGAATLTEFQQHAGNKNNPHQITPEQLGLGNVDNTSDANKPISIRTQKALDAINEVIEEIRAQISADNMVTSVQWIKTTTTLVFGFANGDDLTVVFPIADVFNTMHWDEETNELVFTLPDGTEHRVSITNMITKYTGDKSTNIKTTVTDDGKILAEIIPNSIDGTCLKEDINLRGNPSTNTQPIGDNTKKLATTEFVNRQTYDGLDSYDQLRPLSANMGRILNAEKTSVQDVLYIIENTPLLNIVDNLTSTDPYASLSANMGRQLNLIKADKVHTSSSGATFGKASSQLFGHARAGSISPLMDGTADPGTDDGYFARADHRHPSDDTKAPLYWPKGAGYKLEGDVRAETPPEDSNDDHIATTEWVQEFGIDSNRRAIRAHIDDHENPHHVTLEQLGAASAENVSSHLADRQNPHQVTAAQVGLGNVNNTSDADKPISTAAALKFKKVDNNISALAENKADNTRVNEISEAFNQRMNELSQNKADKSTINEIINNFDLFKTDTSEKFTAVGERIGATEERISSLENNSATKAALDLTNRNLTNLTNRVSQDEATYAKQTEIERLDQRDQELQDAIDTFSEIEPISDAAIIEAVDRIFDQVVYEHYAAFGLVDSNLSITYDETNGSPDLEIENGNLIFEYDKLHPTKVDTDILKRSFTIEDQTLVMTISDN